MMIKNIIVLAGIAAIGFLALKNNRDPTSLIKPKKRVLQEDIISPKYWEHIGERIGIPYDVTSFDNDMPILEINIESDDEDHKMIFREYDFTVPSFNLSFQLSEEDYRTINATAMKINSEGMEELYKEWVLISDPRDKKDLIQELKHNISKAKDKISQITTEDYIELVGVED